MNRIALMSAFSPDLERQVSDTTQVGEDYVLGDLNPTEEATVRLNIDQASPADGPYVHVGPLSSKISTRLFDFSDNF